MPLPAGSRPADRPPLLLRGAGRGHRHGAEVEYEGEGLPARCFQHELDHLNGKLYLDLHPVSVRKRLEREAGELPWSGLQALDPRSELYTGPPEE